MTRTARKPRMYGSEYIPPGSETSVCPRCGVTTWFGGGIWKHGPSRTPTCGKRVPNPDRETFTRPGPVPIEREQARTVAYREAAAALRTLAYSSAWLAEQAAVAGRAEGDAQMIAQEVRRIAGELALAAETRRAPQA